MHVQAAAAEKIERRLAADHREDRVIRKGDFGVVGFLEGDLVRLDPHRLGGHGERDRPGRRAPDHVAGQRGGDALELGVLDLHVGHGIRPAALRSFSMFSGFGRENSGLR